MRQGFASIAAVAVTCVFAGAPATVPLRAQVAAGPAARLSQLDATLHRIFADEEFSAKSFGPARWLESGNAFVTLEPSASVKGVNPPAAANGAAAAPRRPPPPRDIVRYDTATGRREILVAASQLIPPGASAPLAIEDYAWSEDMKRLLIFTNTARVWRQNTRGDYWVLDRATGVLRKLGGDAPPASLMFAKLSPDGGRATYVRSNNIYVEDIASGHITPLTSDGSPTLINGTSDWVYEEELGVRDAFRWSPDGHRIAYWQFDTRPEQDFPLMYFTGGPHQIVTHIPYPEYGIYPHLQHIPYPQPGTPNATVRIGVVSAAGGPTRWMDVTGDPQSSYIARVEWAGHSDELVIQHLNRRQNINDVLLANASTGAVQQVHREQDAAWVDVVDDLQWLDGGKHFLWVSEQDGWRHVYVISRDGKNVRLATPGAFDVIRILQVQSPASSTGVPPVSFSSGTAHGQDARGTVDRQAEWLYYIASPENATERYLYRVRLDGGAPPERLTPAGVPGTHSYQISPDCQWAFHTYSTFDSPPAIDLVRLPEHSVARVLEDNHELRAKVKALIPGPTEFFGIDVGGGVTLDAYIVKPPHFDPAKKYPLLVNVYGEPAAQTVLDSWHGEGTLMHDALAADGYLIASIDNRGTPAPKGRQWRKIIYGAVGVLSSQEQAAALKTLERTRPYIDAARVAVWGWSGGGTNTLNLMFRHPELYKVGMAVAPVPDQRLYDSIYQERYMGLPQENAKGYEEGSAINFAEGLRGPLLIVHGTGDDNVHFQGTELLVNRLIELGKQFQFMVYPDRTHAISEGPGTSLNLRLLLAHFLEEHLPPGPVGR